MANILFDYDTLKSQPSVTTAQFNDMQMEYMVANATSTRRHYNDLMYDYLGELGYTGSLTERIDDYKENN